MDHRIAVAGVDRPLFSAAALRRVHRYSGGVPRLINLLCDRALLGAAVSRRMQVTPDIVTRAAREVHGSDDGSLPQRGRTVALGLSLLLALAGGVWLGETNVVERVPKTLMTWTGQLNQGGEVAALTPDLSWLRSWMRVGCGMGPKPDRIRAATLDVQQPELAIGAEAPDFTADQAGPTAQSPPVDDAVSDALFEPVTQAETDTEPDEAPDLAQAGADPALLEPEPEPAPPESPSLPETLSDDPRRGFRWLEPPVVQEIDADGLADLLLPYNATVDQFCGCGASRPMP